ncbi:glycosyltransferase [Chthonomonas calidirosea]|uniref:glycosyltransferase family 4 protein n=1 Tax=Chthonomonas calidirosea TaxID=454171 RepID=UPI0006DD3ADA|nr:glycosyltransferase family 4 protein [Chthonomonas calidirosea]CEK15947.1 glycosyltransferase [Chthonomonas calidirosea]
MADPTSKRRILLIGMGWFPEQPGGLDRVYYELFNRLQSHYPTELTLRGLVVGTDNVAQQTKQQVTAYADAQCSVLKRLLAARRAIREAVQTFQPDVVVSHFALYTFPALDVLQGKPFVFHFHGPWALEGGAEKEHGLTIRLKKSLERAVYKKAQHFIVLSKAFQEILADQYGIAKERIHIIPGGIDLKQYASPNLTKQEARKQLNWPQNRNIILVVRRLQRRMGIELLLKAIAHLKSRYPNLLVLVAGKGPLRQELEALIHQLQIEAHARLLGFLPDEQLPIAYRAADFTVVPTLSLEGFGLITIESLAAGTPVLVTPVGGLPEVVRPFRPEWVAEAATEEALTERLQRILLGDIAFPSPAECQAYVQQHYDWSVVLPRILQVYDMAIQSHRLQ